MKCIHGTHWLRLLPSLWFPCGGVLSRPGGWLSQLECHPDVLKGSSPCLGHVEETPSECINKWDSKLLPISLPV